MIYELPPMPRGTTDEQLRDLRDYLVRLINQLNESSPSAQSSTLVQRSETK